jgi:hypothetical protein
MLRPLLILCTVLRRFLGFAVAQATYAWKHANLQGPRSLPEQTATAAIRDYLAVLASYEQPRLSKIAQTYSIRISLELPKTNSTETIQQQTALGIRTRYQDRAHDIQIVFYSPEGLSIELIDKVDYDVQVLDHDQGQNDTACKRTDTS